MSNIKPTESIEVRPLAAGDAAQLGRLLVAVADEPWFQPHEMTEQYAEQACQRDTADAYVGAFDGDELVAYGILRGWDAGWKNPSLGIVVAPRCRGRGIGGKLMEQLHSIARQRGADAVRLRVSEDNGRARRLYEALGYDFSGERERGELVGWRRVSQ